MAQLGLSALYVGFGGILISLFCLLLSQFRKPHTSQKDLLVFVGHIAALISTLALTFCCALLVFCFMTGDTSIQYVVQYQSHTTGELAWLFKVSGLWGGSEGSLLFWAWLISVFNAVITLRNIRRQNRLDNTALLIAQLVLAAFVGVLLFSTENMPFIPLAAEYLDANGNLTGAAQYWGMSVLLEHWAMAIHPPTLFIGYAGMTIPFAYAIAALINNDSSRAWVDACSRITIFSWLFLSLGIGLGAVWAYVVLGWGGYWGWDPVENASFLPWLVGVALIHSFTIYQQRGAFKRWSIMCACIAFSFVILGTFITRSGLVESVHAFAGDPVSLYLFLGLIACSFLMGLVGVLIRWKSFGAEKEHGDDFDALISKDAAYYLNNLIMVLAAFLLAYLTLSSALPGWLPFGGYILSAETYEAIARPFGIAYLFLLAVCPLLGWGKTDRRQFLKHARIPALCALIAFVLLMVFYATTLLPTYEATIAAGGPAAEKLMQEGPAWYYNGLAAIGLLVASLLFFNSLYMLGKGIRGYAKKHQMNPVKAAFSALKNHAATYGGFVSHLAMAVILVGLIGSAMYDAEKIDYISYDESTDTAGNDYVFGDYTLRYVSNSVTLDDEERNIYYTTVFDVYKNGELVGTVHPSIQMVVATQQKQLHAEVISFPTEDLFVMYRGVDPSGNFALDVRINPLISCVWIGFALLMIGVIIATIGRRKPRILNKATEIPSVETEVVVKETDE